MILFKRHHHGPEPPAHYRPTRRRRLNDASEMTVTLPQPSATTSSSVMGTRPISKCAFFPTTIPSACPTLTSFCTLPNVTFPTSFVRKRQPCPPQPPRTTAGISSLPTELLLKVLFHLPLIDIIQVAQTSRKFYTLSQDYSLQKHLDLSGLCIRYPPTSIATLLATAHSLTIIPPSTTTTRTITTTYLPPLATYEPTLLHSFYHIASSPNLTSITLRALPRKYIAHLHFLFSHLQTQKLQHVDLARTYVPNHLLSLITYRYGGTLVSLDLEFAVITDLALELLGSPEKLPRLRELGLAGCLGLSEGGLRNLLCDKVYPQEEAVDWGSYFLLRYDICLVYGFFLRFQLVFACYGCVSLLASWNRYTRFCTGLGFGQCTIFVGLYLGLRSRVGRWI
ncbi:hypothetical protein BGX38DRAFT_812128 [Terfezia claveryi]|nr:hypothetical protein BGX38DRAFT_812128 [Terfezia claveryi]